MMDLTELARVTRRNFMPRAVAWAIGDDMTDTVIPQTVGTTLPNVPTNPPKVFPSTADDRSTANVMRHQYRVLSDAEKKTMQKIKDDGIALFDFLSQIGTSRELSLAKTKLEEAVMWAVNHITR